MKANQKAQSTPLLLIKTILKMTRKSGSLEPNIQRLGVAQEFCTVLYLKHFHCSAPNILCLTD